MNAMRMVATILLVTVFAGTTLAQTTCKVTDWAGLSKYRDQNAKLGKVDRGVVLLGGTTIERWDLSKADAQNRTYINRGIAGQTTAQMLLRFRQDVLALRPRFVVLFPTMDDLAGTSGEVSIQEIGANLATMAQLAKANDIKVIFGTLLPTRAGKSDLAAKVPSERIREMDRWMFAYAKEHGDTYADFWSPLGDDKYNMKTEYSDDGVHPNAAGYAVMLPVLERALTASQAGTVGRISVKNEYRPAE